MDLISSFWPPSAPHWLVAGLVLLIAELATGTTFLLWPAIAAWITGVLLFALPLEAPAQLLVFGGLTLCTTLTGRYYVKGRWLGGGDDRLNDLTQSLPGSTAVAVAAFEDGVGRVRLGDSEWRAESADDVAMGDRLRIVAVSGSTLRVEKLD
jgi:membrane protein implicated in regulation of membrane protease activity